MEETLAGEGLEMQHTEVRIAYKAKQVAFSFPINDILFTTR